MLERRAEFFSRCIAIDTETTGKDFKTAEVIEIGYTNHNDAMNSTETFSQLYQPSTGKIPFEVSGITHIDNDMVKFYDVLTEKEVDSVLNQKFSDPVYVAHNSFYDMKVLTRYGLVESTWVCTLKLAEKLLEGNHKYFNLPYLRYAMDIKVNNDLACHRAGTDSLLTMILLDKFVTMMEKEGIINTNEEYLPQILEYMNKPKEITKMPFGKHKGVLLTDVPRSYWKWAIENLDSLNPEAENFDEALLNAINKALS